MSVNMDGSGISYADHDVHHIRHSVETAPGEPDVSDYVSEQSFEITERGLAPDEIAELKAMRVTVGTVFSAVNAEDSVGSVAVNAGAGFNLSGDEYVGQGSTRTDIDVDDDGDDDIIVRTNDTDEPGQLWTYRDTLSAPFDDDTNGNGGGAYKTQQVELFVFEDMFGSGPYVDSADDFTSLVQLNETANTAQIGADVRYSLYYDVSETEGGRTRFGR